MIGEKRAELLLSGEISAERFRELQFDKNFRPMSLEKMREMEPEIFEKVFDEKITTWGGGNVIFNIMNDQIENKRTGVGDPYSIWEYKKTLSRQQQRILDSLPEYGSRATVDKDAISMIDLSALTAKTDNEFALFTLGSERLVVRGNTESVPITTQDAAELNRQGYKWSGHTHVGGTKNDLRPSRGDRAILKAFNQPTSVVYNSVGQYQTFTHLNFGG